MSMIPKQNKLLYRIDRKDQLMLNMIYDIKADRLNPDYLFFSVANNEEAMIVK